MLKRVFVAGSLLVLGGTAANNDVSGGFLDNKTKKTSNLPTRGRGKLGKLCDGLL